VLLGAGAVGAAGVLAACGNGGNAQPAVPPGGGPAPSGTQTSAGEAAQGQSVPAADIPLGGGKIFQAQTFVVTQPTQGQFRAFDATCTHQQCLVSSIDGGLIMCPCHGSQYHITDGSVARGPATRSLAAKTVTVSGDQVVIG
jgi:Rieske Fe-S protein